MPSVDGQKFWQACIEPRPEICTHIYQPVCGLTDTSLGCITAPCPATASKTYGNACAACSDIRVSAYYEGECDAKGESSSDKSTQDQY